MKIFKVFETKGILVLINYYCQVWGWNWLKTSFVFMEGGGRKVLSVDGLVRNSNINPLLFISRIGQSMKHIGPYIYVLKLNKKYLSKPFLK